MLAMVEATTAPLPAEKPRYLMGAGTPSDLIAAVARGRGHVRLRTSDPQRPERHGFHRDRQGGDQKLPARV